MNSALNLFTATRGISVSNTPEPSYFSKSSLLEGSWASWLVTAMTHGQLCTMRAGGSINPADDDMFIVLAGCVVVTGIDQHADSKPLFVSAMKCGDIIIKPQYSSVEFTYAARGEVQLLHLGGEHFREFSSSVKNSEAGIMATELTLLSLHGSAAHSLLLDENARVLRVAKGLAEHPDVPRTKEGVVVTSTKEELLSYAAIFNRRIGARAFKALEQTGQVVFDGYKKFIYRTDGGQIEHS